MNSFVVPSDDIGDYTPKNKNTYYGKDREKRKHQISERRYS